MTVSNNNSRNLRGLHGRQVDLKRLRARFLIVCEGEKTEPEYFKRFPVASAQVEVIGEGYNTISLVERAIQLRQERDFSEETDQVWCVFDKDSFSAYNFNTAIQRAKQEGIMVAYSNEAFELWYLLHFDYHDAALDRHQYIEKLTIYFKQKYHKNDRRLYEKLLDRQPVAMRNAQTLYANHTNSPANDNPSSTVFLLVEALNEHVK